MNPTKNIYIQQAQLQRYLLECISQPLQLISAQSNAHAQTAPLDLTPVGVKLSGADTPAT